MLTGLVVLLCLLGLGVFSLIGLFNKKVAARLEIVFFLIRRLKINLKNLERLPRQFKGLAKIIPAKRGLLWRLFVKNRKKQP